MLTTEAIEKAIEMYESGATEAAVAEGTGVSPAEARAVAEALHIGETDRLFREVALAGVLEVAAEALRSGRGLIGDGAGDVVREVWHSYPNAGIRVGDTDRKASAHAGGFDQAETEKDKPMRGTCNILVERDGTEEECGKPSVYSEPCCCGACDAEFGHHEPTHYCADHFDELVILPERCWHCGSVDHGPAACAPKQDTLL